MVDIPYRTLQNYLLNKRSPNVDALKKLHNNGLDITWLVTGDGAPYKHQSLNQKLVDKVFLSCTDEILKKCLSADSKLFNYDEKARLISFMMGKNYLGIGECLRFFISEGYLADFEEVEDLYNSGDLDEMLESEPSNPSEMWKALQKVKEYQKRDLISPRPVEEK